MEQAELHFPYHKFYQLGHLVLVACLIIGLILSLLLANSGSIVYTAALPVAIIGALFLCFLFAAPTLGIASLILGFILMASNESGFQAIEIIYAACLFLTLIAWFIHYKSTDINRVIVQTSDWCLAIFLGVLPLSLILTYLFQGDFRVAASEIISLLMLLVYFPVKHIVAHEENGPKIILTSFIIMCTVVAIVNSFEYATDLSNAIALSQIAGSRVTVNDTLLLFGATMSLSLVLKARGPLSFLLPIIALAFTFAGLIMTQSRGAWMALLFGVTALFFFVQTSDRIKILTIGAILSAVIIGLGYILVGPYLNVILTGIFERFGSIGSAITQDLALVNRFRETSVVFEKVIVNPLVGYGPGVSYIFFDLVHQSTDMDTFVHNGYVGLWYKFGLWGLGLLMIFWYSSVKLGLRAYRSNSIDHWTRLAGLAGAIPLIALIVTTIVGNPFFLKNHLFVIAIAAGLASGAGQRIAQHHHQL